MTIRHDKIDELFRLEERCLNAWPGLHTVLHEGWQLRFSGGYTKRANSVIPYLCANEQNRLAERIDYCESAYAAAGLAPVFKLVSFAEPEWLDRELEKRGYGIVEPSGVWTVGLANIAPPETDSAAFFPSASGEWLDAFAALSGLDESALRIAVRLLSGPCLHRGFFLIREQKVPVACGVGIIERGDVGLYDIVTHRDYRNRGYGGQLMMRILNWAKQNGATRGYLMVVQNNAPAVHLYRKLGFREAYAYWYRRKAFARF